MSKATTQQIAKDHALSRRPAAKPAKSFGLREKWQITVALAQEYAATTLVILYVVNGVLASAILFDIVQAPQTVRFAVAALAVAYAAVGFVMFVNRGVKHQIAERKTQRGE